VQKRGRQVEVSTSVGRVGGSSGGPRPRFPRGRAHPDKRARCAGCRAAPDAGVSSAHRDKCGALTTRKGGLPSATTTARTDVIVRVRHDVQVDDALQAAAGSVVRRPKSGRGEEEAGRGEGACEGHLPTHGSDAGVCGEAARATLARGASHEPGLGGFWLHAVRACVLWPRVSCRPLRE
jgi:hypothetical protein